MPVGGSASMMAGGWPRWVVEVLPEIVLPPWAAWRNRRIAVSGIIRRKRAARSSTVVFGVLRRWTSSWFDCAGWQADNAL